MLYLIATPIGNLKEITYRAVETLNSVDYIACEDTRTSRILLNNYGIKKPLKSYHKFNENKSGSEIIADLKNGLNVAVISDAGTPGISDPGNILVNMCKKENLPYTVVSGPSALINAFVLSGFETPFTFVGFLPETKGKKTETLSELPKNTTLIFYCSPHSIVEDLKDMLEILGDREICIVREISKKFEEVSFSSLKNGINCAIKGEFVVVVKKQEKESVDEKSIDKNLEILLNMGLSKTEACKVLAKLSGTRKQDIYSRLKSN